jgi:ferredoxin
MIALSKIKVLYFSGTGTTEKVVCTLARELGEKLGLSVEPYDFSTPAAREPVQQFGADELVIVGMPVYAGRMPNLFLPYLTGKLQGAGNPAIPVVLYGNRNFDDGLIELRNILETNGMRTVAGAAFIGEHSFSRILGANRPDADDMAVLSEFAEGVAAKLKGMDALPETPVTVKGEDPIRPYYTPRDRHGNPVNILKVKPLTDVEKCVKCGLCATLCPMGSIDKEDPAKIEGICIKCCACVKGCPAGAKYFTDEGYLYHQHELEEMYERRGEVEMFL